MTTVQTWRHDLVSRRFVQRAPAFTRLGHDVLRERVAEVLDDGRVRFTSATLLMELTARTPYVEGVGNIDVYRPGRWDTASNLVFMDTIVQGASPGMWEGSASYVEFRPPAAATYLVVGNVTGYQTTAHLLGPWGETTTYTAQTSDSGAVLAVCTTGEPFEFHLDFTAPDNDYGLGYIESVQVFTL